MRYKFYESDPKAAVGFSEIGDVFIIFLSL